MMPCVRRSLSYVFVCLVLIASVVTARELPTAAPDKVGMCAGRLDRIDTFIEGAVDEDRLAGAVTMVGRRGRVVHLKAFGMMDRESGKPMRTDTIFRIASMTKPVTSVAVMMLYEEGKLLLDDPVAKYIPEFGKPRVLVLDPSGNGDPAKRRTVPARQAITVRHLLSHTSGLSYQWNEHLGQAYKDAGVTHGLLQDDGTLAEKMKRLATVPLLNHPGEAYEYGLSIDVLGYLVEVVSGKTLDEFFRERIFDPLRMKDTYFFPPKEKLGRLAAVYERSEDGQLKKVSEEPIVDGSFVYSIDYPYNGPRRYFSGGGGLCSTAPDYMRFCQMLLNGGELDGARILSRKTVELMTTNHIGELSAWQQQKFGLGFFILTDPGQSNLNASPGSYGWGGFFTTRFLIDPKEQLIAISMTQLRPGHDVPINDVVPILAIQAITD
jgi:CubicO group peptidase (beta-lactamase class C family)